MIGAVPISWSSKKQGMVTLSSCETEFFGTSYAAQLANLCGWLEELESSEVVKINMLVDKKSVIDQANHPISHEMSKHIEMKYHLLRN